jgi:sporulation protein YlmC with PRC-barrel domain
MEKKYLSLDNVVGKQVIDSNATIVGNVKEVTFDTSMKTIALKVTAKEGNDIAIEGGNITAIGDVVLLKPKEAPPTAVPTTHYPTSPGPTTPGLCSNCKYQNDINTKFCIKCGTKLQ